MKRIVGHGVMLCLVVFAGCASIVGPSTDDPAVKLKWASELFNSKDEPVEAEELIREAIRIYKKENNQLGLAEAYQQYGLFYRSNAVVKFEFYFREKGFEEHTVKYEQRYEKAIECFSKARDLFADYGHIDRVSNLYISLAKTYDMMNRQKEACDAYSKGLENFTAYKQQNPEAIELRSEEMQRYAEYIGIMKKQSGCPEDASGDAGSGRGEQSKDRQTAGGM